MAMDGFAQEVGLSDPPAFGERSERGGRSSKAAMDTEK
jgi:hypothetical protein